LVGVSADQPEVLIAGATGYIGGLLAKDLRADDVAVRALARDRSRAGELERSGCEVVEADVLEAETLPPALEGIRVAYYLVHSMGRGAADAEFAQRDIRAAENFATAAADAGVERIVYLGGLGEPGSEHLQSRHHTAEILAQKLPLTYFRAAAVIGSGSESFRVVYYLVKRLPLMVTPSWVTTKTQPIAVDDVVAYLKAALQGGPETAREIEIGGPEVTTYGGMMERMATAMDRRAPVQIPVPLLTPRLSSLWIGLVTPVDVGVARPLVEGLATETIVRDDSGMALFDVERTGLDEAMRRALNETD
jgi:uncharacterized protein YbjT (DUF2867 family)